MMGSVRLIPLLITAVLFLSEGILCGSVMALNRVTGLYFSEKDEQAVLALRMENRPGFSLHAIQGNQMTLTLRNTAGGTDLERSVSENDAIEIAENKATSDLTVRAGLKKAVHEIDCSWIEPDKLLFIRIFHLKSECPMSRADPNNLKGIRFGFKEKAVRMVIKLEHKPGWEMKYLNTDSLDLLLEAESADIQEKKYGPMQGVHEVKVLNRKDKKIDVSLQLEFPLNRVRTFWMEVGNRLVMDFFEEPAGIPESLKEGPISAERGMEKTGDMDKPSTESPGQDIKPVVRMKIPNRGRGGNPHADPSPMIEPRIDDTFPFTSDMSGSIEGLSPREAFLFGRIQEAMEIHDAEKGALLVGQFMDQFPRSRLSERMAFWRGDFYYNLWKRGDKEAGPKVIRSYRYAVDRYTHSDFKPLAYIKMAQVCASIGKYIESVGYIGLIIGQKEGNGYLPLAHLTRGKIFLEMGRPEHAVKDFQVLLEEYRGTEISAEASFLMAGYYHTMGLYEEAAKCLRAISDSNPDIYLEYPEYLLLSAKNNLYLKNFDRAREYLFKAVNIGQQPETVDMLLSRIGDTYHNQDKEREAEKYYRMVMDYYPDSEGASMAKLRLADYFSDIIILEDLSREKSNEPVGDLAVLEKAYQLFEKKKYQATMDTLKQLVDQPVQTETRKDAKLLYYHAAENEIEKLYDSGDYKKLITLYLPDKTNLTENIHPEKLLYVALAFHHTGRYGEAVSVFSGIKAFDLDKKRRGAYYYHLADSYLGTGDNRKAIRLLEESKEQELESDDRQRLSVLLADLYREKGRLENAYKLYASVVGEKSELPAHEIAEVYLSMGIILHEQGKYEEAKTLLNKCLSLAGRSKEPHECIKSAYMVLGNIYHAQENFNKAVENLELGFRLGYGSDEADYWENRYRLALSYARTGQESNAEDLLTEIMEEGTATLQQRAQIKLGMMSLNRQLEHLSMGTNQHFGRENEE